MSRSLLALLACLFLAAPAASQTPPCDSAEFHQFDFWIGHWRVENAAGAVQGHNTITSTADGCGLREEWVGQSGGTGTSLNYHDPADGQWHQHWVGGSGMILHLAGGLDGDSMVLAGDRQGPKGPVRDRITWTPGDDGRVRQFWEVSGDDGKTWNVAFEGFYVRAD